MTKKKMENLLNKKSVKSSLVEEIRREVKRWNLLYPLDKWYRDKYNIQYGSKEHKKLELINIRASFEEDVLYIKSIKSLSNATKDEYVPSIGEWLSKPQVQDDVSQKEIEDIYNNIDLSKLDGDVDEIILE